jgi:hypothetical protein
MRSAVGGAGFSDKLLERRPPRGRQTGASLCRLVAAAPATGAPASAIAAAADPLACQGTMGGTGRRRGAASAASRRRLLVSARGPCGDARDATRRMPGPDGRASPSPRDSAHLHHVPRDLRARGRTHTVGEAHSLTHRGAARTVGPRVWRRRRSSHREGVSRTRHVPPSRRTLVVR